MMCNVSPVIDTTPDALKGVMSWKKVENMFWDVVFENPSNGFFSLNDNVLSIVLNVRAAFTQRVCSSLCQELSEAKVEDALNSQAFNKIYYRFVRQFLDILADHDFKYNAVLITSENQIQGIVYAGRYYNFSDPLCHLPFNKDIENQILHVAAGIAHEEFSRAAQGIIEQYQPEKKTRERKECKNQ